MKLVTFDEGLVGRIADDVVVEFAVPSMREYFERDGAIIGDLIFTGTPSGVGNRRTPQRFLAAGDVLESTIESLGTMRHTFTA
jgi:hypothetical protein